MPKDNVSPLIIISRVKAISVGKIFVRNRKKS